MSLFEHLHETLLALWRHHTAHKDVWNSHADGYEEDDERGTDTVVHSYGNFAHYSVHINDGEERTIHEHSRNHRDDARYAEAMVRSVEPMHSLGADDTDESTTHKGAYDETTVETDIAVGRSEVDKIACAHSDDTTYSHSPKQATRNVEYHRESHG